MPTDAKHPVKTTERTLEIVETLGEVGSAGVTELADRTGLGKSAVHNHLTTLREHGYVTRSDDGYRLSLKFLTLGGRVRSRHELYRIAKPTIEKLEIETGGMYRLVVEEEGRGVVLYQSERSKAITDRSYIGQRPYLHTTAEGKAILASMSREQVDTILERYGLPAVTENTVTDRDRLAAELERVRDQGYATAEEEWVVGVSSLGTAITDEDGAVIGAISLVKPLTESGATAFDTDERVDLLVDAAETIEINVEHSWYRPNKFLRSKHR